MNGYTSASAPRHPDEHPVLADPQRRSAAPARRRLGTRILGLSWALIVLVSTSACHSTTPPPTTAAASRQALHQLQVVPQPAPDPTYRRAAFGRAWADVDGDGCNTRDQVLFATVDKAQPFRVRRQGNCPTDMFAGTWTDLYTGATMTWTDLKDPSQAEKLPLDHIVSLAGAWRDGARDWTPQQRLAFANDPIELQPTTESINRSKSDHDADTWTPPPAGRCGYATRYIAVKAHYRLPVGQTEEDALDRMLNSCDG